MSRQPGLSLLDIADLSEEIPIGDSFIRVKGISAKEAVAILKRYPAVAELTKGFTVQKFVEVMPDAVAAILATATGKPGDVDAEDAASRLPLELQFELLEKIGGLTFKSGFGPFVARMMALADAANSVRFGKASDTSLPLQSKPSSQPAMPQT
jgi:hypothetical protein